MVHAHKPKFSQTFLAMACSKFFPCLFLFVFPRPKFTLATFCMSIIFLTAIKPSAKLSNGPLINYRYKGPFYNHFCTNNKYLLNNYNKYQEYLVAFKLMTSKVIQRGRPLRMSIYIYICPWEFLLQAPSLAL